MQASGELTWTYRNLIFYSWHTQNKDRLKWKRTMFHWSVYRVTLAFSAFLMQMTSGQNICTAMQVHFYRVAKGACPMCDKILYVPWFSSFIQLYLCFCLFDIQVPSGLPRNLEAALHRYGSSTYKALAVTVLDQNGKPTVNLTYGTCYVIILCISETIFFSSTCMPFMN
jgi:hypothetical protein